MAQKNTIKVYIEQGQKKTIASALNWPGWCRGGKDQQAALAALLAYSLKYAVVVGDPQFDFLVPNSIDQFEVVEQLEGNATTDFGAPAVAPSADQTPLDQSELDRNKSLLGACWAYFDRSVARAVGQELRKGPRGGGRDLEKILHHVIEGDRAYLRRLAFKPSPVEAENMEASLIRTRGEIITALETAVTQGLPEHGPRGGAIWTPRYFIRRTAYHVLDHAWEIEDRLVA